MVELILSENRPNKFLSSHSLRSVFVSYKPAVKFDQLNPIALDDYTLFVYKKVVYKKVVLDWSKP